MLRGIEGFAQRWARIPPWTDVYGLGRTLLALSTLSTLVSTPTDSLFRPVQGISEYPFCSTTASFSLFCVVPGHALDWARLAGIAILLVVASGWRPRLTAIPHWWVAYSIQMSASIPDGGDQTSAVLTLLILPVALTDARRWHWQEPADHYDAPHRALTAALTAWSALLVIRVQVAFLYLHASVGKLAVAEWVDGTSIYYWFVDPMFGLPRWAEPVGTSLVLTPWGVAMITWGTIVVEFALFMGLIAVRRARPYLLVAGLLLHLSIGVLMGLGSFSLAMFAALILFLRPSDLHFGLLRRVSAIRDRMFERYGRSARNGGSAETRPIASDPGEEATGRTVHEPGPQDRER